MWNELGKPYPGRKMHALLAPSDLTRLCKETGVVVAVVALCLSGEKKSEGVAKAPLYAERKDATPPCYSTLPL